MEILQAVMVPFFKSCYYVVKGTILKRNKMTSVNVCSCLKIREKSMINTATPIFITRDSVLLLIKCRSIFSYESVSNSI